MSGDHENGADLTELLPVSRDVEATQNLQSIMLLVLWKVNGRSKKPLTVTSQDRANMLHAFDGGPPVLWTENHPGGVRFRLISIAEAREIAAALQPAAPAETLQ